MVGYDDKRAYFRMIMNSPCELKVQGEDSGPVFNAVCKDISSVGMSFQIKAEDYREVDVGTELSVTIESTNAQIASLHATTKVVRIEGDEAESENTIVGVEILSMQ